MPPGATEAGTLFFLLTFPELTVPGVEDAENSGVILEARARDCSEESSLRLAGAWPHHPGLKTSSSQVYA